MPSSDFQLKPSGFLDGERDERQEREEMGKRGGLLNKGTDTNSLTKWLLMLVSSPSDLKTEIGYQKPTWKL